VKKKNIVMNVDYFDELGLHDEPMGPKQVEALVKECAERGVDTIFWRAAGIGIAGYPSKVLASPEKTAKTAYSLVAARAKDTPYAGLGKPREDADRLLRASLTCMDPLSVARDACHRHGLKFFVWLDPFDEMCSYFVFEHPECQILGRDGKSSWPGMRSYCIKEAVENQLAVVDEVLAYHPDGLYLSTSCHSRHLQFPEPDDFFGFEKPVVESYKKRVGRGIDEGTFDADAWNDIKGDGFTEFLRQTSLRSKKTGAKLAVATQFGKHTVFASPYFSTHIPYRFTTQWKRWIDEGIADILVLGDYEWTWDPGPVWEAKGISVQKGRYAADELTPEYVKYVNGRAECLLFSSWLSAYAQHHKGASAADLEGAMRMRSATIKATGADGICLHEAHTFEHYKGFDTVSEMRRSLDAVK